MMAYRHARREEERGNSEFWTCFWGWCGSGAKHAAVPLPHWNSEKGERTARRADCGKGKKQGTAGSAVLTGARGGAGARERVREVGQGREKLEESEERKSWEEGGGAFKSGCRERLITLR